MRQADGGLLSVERDDRRRREHLALVVGLHRAQRRVHHLHCGVGDVAGKARIRVRSADYGQFSGPRAAGRVDVRRHTAVAVGVAPAESGRAVGEYPAVVDRGEGRLELLARPVVYLDEPRLYHYLLTRAVEAVQQRFDAPVALRRRRYVKAAHPLVGDGLDL